MLFVDDDIELNLHKQGKKYFDLACCISLVADMIAHIITLL